MAGSGQPLWLPLRLQIGGWGLSESGFSGLKDFQDGSYAVGDFALTPALSLREREPEGEGIGREGICHTPSELAQWAKWCYTAAVPLGDSANLKVDAGHTALVRP